jgi:hypothetical protein
VADKRAGISAGDSEGDGRIDEVGKPGDACFPPTLAISHYIIVHSQTSVSPSGQDGEKGKSEREEEEEEEEEDERNTLTHSQSRT